jgi:hypothetical protein
MIKSDSLDNITLDSNDILTIERFENNYYNHKNNIIQNGGSTNTNNKRDKLKKNIARLYNCYVLLQLYNQNGGDNNNYLSSQIKKRLHKKITELNELEGGISIKEKIQDYLKKKIKDTINYIIIPFIKKQLNENNINTKITELINRQKLNETIKNIIIIHIKPEIVNFINAQEIDVGQIMKKANICLLDHCKNMLGIKGGCSGCTGYSTSTSTNTGCSTSINTGCSTSTNTGCSTSINTGSLIHNKIIYNNDFEGGSTDLTGEKVKVYLIDKINNSIIPFIENKLDATNINIIAVDLLKNINLNETISGIITKITPHIDTYIDKIDFINSMPPDVENDNCDITGQSGGFNLQDYLKNNIKDTINNTIIPFIKTQLEATNINTTITKLINNINLNKTISDIIIIHIKPEIVNFINNQEIDVGRIMKDAKICLLDHCKHSLGIQGGGDNSIIYNELSSQNKIIYNYDFEGGRTDLTGYKIKNYLEDKINNSIIPFITNNLHSTNINKIAVEFVNQRNLNDDIIEILLNFIKPKVNEYIEQTDFIDTIKTFVENHFKQCAIAVKKREDARYKDYRDEAQAQAQAKGKAKAKG